MGWGWGWKGGSISEARGHFDSGAGVVIGGGQGVLGVGADIVVGDFDLP